MTQSIAEARGSSFVVVALLVGGLLDATVVTNTANFGIGVYIAIGGVATFFLAWQVLLQGRSASLPAVPFVAALVCVGLLWLIVSLQMWSSLGSTASLLRQTALRTILFGHFVLCATFFAHAEKSALVRRALLIFLCVFVGYGLYDFAAQVFSLPRFLDPLRNSQSVAVTQSVGAQGWIRLPRLASLAAEPSHTLMPLAMTFFAAAYLGGWRRIALTVAALLFAIGTFSRTIWLALAAAGGLAIGVALVARVWRSPRVGNALLVGAALALPLAVLVVPFFVISGVDSDSSIIERLDSSRVGFWLFLESPLLGHGFQGWEGLTYRFAGSLTGSATELTHVHNGMAVYLASLGVWGLAVIYAPLIWVLKTPFLGLAGKGWWIGAYSLALFGGDYLGLPSTWTVVALACSGALRVPESPVTP